MRTRDDVTNHRHISRHVRRAIAVWATCALLSLSALPAVAIAPAPEPPAGPHAETALELTAGAAIAVDLTTGLQLFAHNADTRLAPASTMKLVTALTALSVLDRQQTVTVTDADMIDATVYSTMGLQPGDMLTVEELLYGLLVASGGDAAMALARAGGAAFDGDTDNPVARFVEEMNAVAQRLGMTNSHFVEPTGADNPDQFVSARDLVRAAEAALNDWLLARIVATQTVAVDVDGPNPRILELFNSNALVARDDVFGIKTGTEELAGQCLVAGFWRGDNQVITVVLGSQDRYADTAAVMDDVDARLHWQMLGIGTRSLGAADDLVEMGLEFRFRRTVLMTRETSEALTYTLTLREPELPSGQRGEVIFRVGARVIARLPVYTAGTLGVAARDLAALLWGATRG